MVGRILLCTAIHKVETPKTQSIRIVLSIHTLCLREVSSRRYLLFLKTLSRSLGVAEDADQGVFRSRYGIGRFPVSAYKVKKAKVGTFSLSRVLHYCLTCDHRSKSLGEIGFEQGPAFLSAALEQAQENAARSNIRSRSLCGRPFRVSSDADLGHTKLDRTSMDADSHELTTLTCDETREDIMEHTYKESSLPIFKQDDEGGDEDENNWSPAISNNMLVDQDTTLWSITTEAWSPSVPETLASMHSTPHVPRSAPNTLTSTYLPFSFHLALTNHLHSSTLTLYEHVQTPIFIHGMLQLPCTLSALLGLPTSDLLCRLTPAILLNHTTHLDATTLLPSLVNSDFQSTYRHVNGLVYFPKTSACIDKLNGYFASHTPKVELRRVTTQIQDSNGKRHDIAAWAWIAENAEGTEEWWTCEDFVAGRVVGLQNVNW